MINVIADSLFTVPDILTPQECAEFIERGEGIGFESATVSTMAGPRMMTQVRNNDRVVFDDSILAESLWKRTCQFVPPQIGSMVPSGLNERFRFYRYDPSQRFNAHRDGIVERSATESSRLTFMIYLNEGFGGGQTIFYSEERINGLRQTVASVEPVTGMGLFFAHQWWHEGANLTAGRKYVLRTDVMYHDAGVEHERS